MPRKAKGILKKVEEDERGKEDSESERSFEMLEDDEEDAEDLNANNYDCSGWEPPINEPPYAEQADKPADINMDNEGN